MPPQKLWFFQRWEWQDYLHFAVLVASFPTIFVPFMVWEVWYAGAVKRMQVVSVRTIKQGVYKIDFRGPLGRIEWIVQGSGVDYSSGAVSTTGISPNEMLTLVRHEWYNKFRAVKQMRELGYDFDVPEELVKITGGAP